MVTIVLSHSGKDVCSMTLQQVIKEAGLLSDEDLAQVIQFMGFLRFSKSRKPLTEIEQTDSKKYRTRGGLSGRVILADDFNETPECFKEYM